MQVLNDILELIADARLFLARTLLQKLEAFIESNTDRSIGERLKSKVEAHSSELSAMRERAAKVEDTIADLDTVR